jgi:hypothetical protein
MPIIIYAYNKDILLYGHITNVKIKKAILVVALSLTW